MVLLPGDILYIVFADLGVQGYWRETGGEASASAQLDGFRRSVKGRTVLIVLRMS